jgi:glycosyltransferase involved in cell wall biosynthesis
MEEMKTEQKAGSASLSGRGVILIPAFNEEASLPTLLAEVRRELPDWAVVVINDGSSDRTSDVARRCGATVLDLPCNLGVGGTIQAGFQYALNEGFDYALRLDADGQHPPAEACKLMQAMKDEGCDLVIGSRFGATNGRISTRVRYFGIKALALFLSIICRSRVTDPTSGFWLLNRRLLALFARSYPYDYPEPEALALLRRLGYSFCEAPVQFRQRTAGQSSIGRWDTIYYAFKVGLALTVDRVRPVDEKLSVHYLKEI